MCFRESLFSSQKLSEFFCGQNVGMVPFVFLAEAAYSMIRHIWTSGAGPTNLCHFFSAQSPSHKSKRQQQELIAELRRRQVKDNRHVYEGKDGAIEDIITGKRYFLVVAHRDPTDLTPSELLAHCAAAFIQGLQVLQVTLFRSRIKGNSMLVLEAYL